MLGLPSIPIWADDVAIRFESDTTDDLVFDCEPRCWGGLRLSSFWGKGMKQIHAELSKVSN